MVGTFTTRPPSPRNNEGLGEPTLADRREGGRRMHSRMTHRVNPVKSLVPPVRGRACLRQHGSIVSVAPLYFGPDGSRARRFYRGAFPVS
jgi:hypothetical protein